MLFLLHLLLLRSLTFFFFFPFFFIKPFLESKPRHVFNNFFTDTESNHAALTFKITPNAFHILNRLEVLTRELARFDGKKYTI